MLHQDYWLLEFISISSVINKAKGGYESSFLLSESDDNVLTYFLLAKVKVILQATDSLNAYLKRKAGFRYTVLSHQSCHGVSHQTARSDLQKLSARELLIAGKDGRREIFRVPENLAARMLRRCGPGAGHGALRSGWPCAGSHLLAGLEKPGDLTPTARPMGSAFQGQSRRARPYSADAACDGPLGLDGEIGVSSMWLQR
jgi:hypothetical protein